MAVMRTLDRKDGAGALKPLESLLWGVPCPFLSLLPSLLCCPPLPLITASLPTPPHPCFPPHSPFSGGAGRLPTRSPQGAQLPLQRTHSDRTPNKDQPRPQRTFQTLLHFSTHTAHGVCVITTLPLGLLPLPASSGFIHSVFLCLASIMGHSAGRGASDGGGERRRGGSRSHLSPKQQVGNRPEIISQAKAKQGL